MKRLSQSADLVNTAFGVSIAGLALLMTIAPLQAAGKYTCKTSVNGVGLDNLHTAAVRKARVDWRAMVVNQYGATYLKHRAAISESCYQQPTLPKWRCAYVARPCVATAKPRSSNAPASVKQPNYGTIR